VLDGGDSRSNEVSAINYGRHFTNMVDGLEKKLKFLKIN
jgi:hypothetical protein